jgi:hypothetical protein
LLRHVFFFSFFIFIYVLHISNANTGALSIIGGDLKLVDVNFTGTNITVDVSDSDNYLSYGALCKNIHCEGSASLSINRSSGFAANESLWLDPGTCSLSGVNTLYSTYTTPVLKGAQYSFDEASNTANLTYTGNYLIPTYCLFQIYSFDPVEKTEVDVTELTDYFPSDSAIGSYIGVVGQEWPIIIKVWFRVSENCILSEFDVDVMFVE